jgi:hypothetical protein
MARNASYPLQGRSESACSGLRILGSTSLRRPRGQNQRRHLRISFPVEVMVQRPAVHVPRSYASSDVASTYTFLLNTVGNAGTGLNMKITHGTFGGQHRCQVRLREGIVGMHACGCEWVGSVRKLPLEQRPESKTLHYSLADEQTLFFAQVSRNDMYDPG